MAEHVLSEDELTDLLGRDVDPADNAPAKVPGIGGLSGSVSTTHAERARRRRTVAQLLVNGSSLDQIVEVCCLTKLPDGKPGLAMSENAVRHLVDVVLDEMQREDGFLAPHAKRLAIRRVKQEIAEARRGGHHTAVASHEKNLMALEGTAAPMRVEGELRLSQAVREILCESDAVVLKELVAEELKHMEAAKVRARAIDAPRETRVLPPER